MSLFAYPDFAYNLTWSIFFYVLLSLTIFLIYRTALTYPHGGTNLVQKRLIHLVNITFGFLLTLIFGFFLFGALFFGSPILDWSLVNYAIPLTIWFLVYVFQIRLANQNSIWLKTSYFLWLYVLVYLVTFFSSIYVPTDMIGTGLNNVFRRILYPIQSSL